jgi:transmembrane sensor
MTEPSRAMAEALTRIDDRWDTARTERTLAGLHGKLGRSQRGRMLERTVAALALSTAAAAAGFWLVRQPEPSELSARSSAAPASRSALTLQLSDGSTIMLRDLETKVREVAASPAHMVLELSAGQASFDVVRRESRVFEVRAGEVTVRVLGTAFEIERDGARTRVSVSRGRVAVSFRD